MSALIQRSQWRDELAHEWGDGTTGEDYVWFLATRVIDQEAEIERLRERQYPFDINADGKAIGIQVGQLGHKIWLCADGQAIVRINRASETFVDDLRTHENSERLQRVVEAARKANIWLFTGRDETGRAEVACDLNAALIALDEASELSAAEESEELKEQLREG